MGAFCILGKDFALFSGGSPFVAFLLGGAIS